VDNTEFLEIMRPSSLNTLEAAKKPIPPAPFVPGSPTDSVMSPVSSAMRKKMPGMANRKGPLNGNFSFQETGFNLETEVGTRIPAPTNGMTLTLGSSSQNRIRIAKQLGWEFDCVVPDIDEKAIRCEDPLELPLLIAKAKAEKIISHDLLKIKDKSKITTKASPDKSSLGERERERILLTADQICLYKNEIRVKPVDREQAIAFLSSYSNESVTCVSALVATHIPSGRQYTDVNISSIAFDFISPDVIEKVVGRGRVFTAAGGFSVEDPDLYKLIKNISGTIPAVMGFPIQSAVRIISEASGLVSPDGSLG
jgi:septum formation protein